MEREIQNAGEIDSPMPMSRGEGNLESSPRSIKRPFSRSSNTEQRSLDTAHFPKTKNGYLAGLEKLTPGQAKLPFNGT